MSRMMISPHDRTDGVPTSKGSAGLNATRDAFDADLLRNMPPGLRPRKAIDAKEKTIKQATVEWNGRRTLATGTIIECAICGCDVIRRNSKQKYCKPCAIEYVRAKRREVY